MTTSPSALHSDPAPQVEEERLADLIHLAASRERGDLEQDPARRPLAGAEWNVAETLSRLPSAAPHLRASVGTYRARGGGYDARGDGFQRGAAEMDVGDRDACIDEREHNRLQQEEWDRGFAGSSRENKRLRHATCASPISGPALRRNQWRRKRRTWQLRATLASTHLCREDATATMVAPLPCAPLDLAHY